jgi:RNA polymerase sigma-70 factor (ECF subfamily)
VAWQLIYGRKVGIEEAFYGERGRLFGIAYRMLGSAAEAEDVVQDAWLRWNGVDQETVRDPAAFLAVTTTRLAINAARSARARRETYVGPWLPEPVDTSTDPALGAERGVALEMAVLRLMERLGVRERAAYVLREAFDYPYRRIGEVLETSEANARQLVTRARARLSAERHEPVDPAEHRRLLSAFLAASREGDLTGLEKLFTAGVVTLTDGGGVVTAARKPVVGVARSARFMVGIGRRLTLEGRIVEFNGRAAVYYPDKLITIGATGRGIDQVLIVRNPAKLPSVVG